MDCSQLPSSFPSYREGLLKVEQASFPINDRVDTSRSSWIRSASYHSCGDGSGFMVLVTDSRTYLHQGVPMEVWEGFKNANSFGSNYNRRIKGRYQLQLH